MITVSQEFKEAVRGNSKEARTYIYDVEGDSYLRDEDDLRRLKLTSQGDIMRTVMRQLDFDYFGVHSFLDKQVKPGIGVVLAPTSDLGAVTISIATPAVLTLTAHGLVTGDKIKLTTTGDLPTGLAEDIYYYVVRIGADTFNLAATYADAVAAAPVLIATSGTQSGTHSVVHYPISGTGDVEYIDYGTFTVVEQKTKESAEYTEAKAYDLMYQSLAIYQPVSNFPLTLKEYLEVICGRLGWTLGTSSFPNDDLEVPAEFYLFERVTYRDVLEHIAEAAASIIYFNIDDELVLRQVDNTVLDTLQTELKELKIELEWGAVNSVAILQEPTNPTWDFAYDGGYESPPRKLMTGDIFLKMDDDALLLMRIVELDGIYQLRSVNNPILLNDKHNSIADLSTALMGIQYHPVQAKTFGNGWFEIGDRVEVVDFNENTVETYIFGIEIEIMDGWRENLVSSTPIAGLEQKRKDPNAVSEIVGKSALDTRNYKDDSITSAKVHSLTADKITTGTLSASTRITIENNGITQIIIGNPNG